MMMHCRKGCGACCISLSIASPLPGMPNGKPAGGRCLHLTEQNLNLCCLYGKAERPSFCVSYQATEEFCGTSRTTALKQLSSLEVMTAQKKRSA